MKEATIQQITITELARSLTTVIDQVRVSSTPVKITKSAHEVAQLVPVAGNSTTLTSLQALLESSPLSEVEKRSFSDDMHIIRQAATGQ